ncbi:MAG: hypothetical protein RSE15_04845 [Flavobacterium sp.]|uniref:hypothetical protein n=1 Tax=Flavobacterium sp. TaxID=239 RepID=UPI002B469D25|nr:hypothetical protein [Flavobacterium sp.]WRH74156.1 MAG: hypothetical protein RSE15_04845 [Flavobacterium sp.]
MSINITNFVSVIEKTELFQSLQGTDKFKQKLLIKNYKNIYHDYEQARRLGLDYVEQYMTSITEFKIIKEIIENDNNSK